MDINKIKKLCKGLGYSVNEKFGEIHIKTKFETWKFRPSNGKTTLFHQGFCSSLHQDFHKEFTEYITAEQLIQYIKEHETAKYTPSFVEYSVFKKKVSGCRMALA